jgi:hypothetical protein
VSFSHSVSMNFQFLPCFLRLTISLSSSLNSAADVGNFALGPFLAEVAPFPFGDLGVFGVLGAFGAFGLVAFGFFVGVSPSPASPPRFLFVPVVLPVELVAGGADSTSSAASSLMAVFLGARPFLFVTFAFGVVSSSVTPSSEEPTVPWKNTYQ